MLNLEGALYSHLLNYVAFFPLKTDLLYSKIMITFNGVNSETDKEITR